MGGGGIRGKEALRGRPGGEANGEFLRGKSNLFPNCLPTIVTGSSTLRLTMIQFAVLFVPDGRAVCWGPKFQTASVLSCPES
jgi:hypothetical protein